jgi:hypothetical protein
MEASGGLHTSSTLPSKRDFAELNAQKKIVRRPEGNFEI